MQVKMRACPRRREVEAAVEKKAALLEGRPANLPTLDRSGACGVINVGPAQSLGTSSDFSRVGSVVHVVSRSSALGGPSRNMTPSDRYAAALSAGANAIQQLQLQQQRFQIQIQMEHLRQQKMRLQALQAHGRQVAQQLLQAPTGTRPPRHPTPP